MRLRPYIECKDFHEIKNWITEERMHTMWCANLFKFPLENVQTVQLNVFPENTRAKKCYESVGFVERKTDLNAFPYKEEAWGRCNMVIRRS